MKENDREKKNEGKGKGKCRKRGKKHSIFLNKIFMLNVT